jgi:DNA-binding NarL/FixJ family response regulator
MTEPNLVALLSSDLMFQSRLEAALAGEPLAVAATGDPAMLPATGMVFVDLNTQVEARIAWIEATRATDPGVTIVGFCHHEDDQLRRRAMEAGASHVVANRHLPKAARRIVHAAELTEVPFDDDGD